MGTAFNRLKITDHFIPDIEWNDIPQFSVITGVNGSGKTQLLNAIQQILSNQHCPYKHESDLSLQKHEYGFIPWNKQLNGLGAASYPDFEKNMMDFSNRFISKRPGSSDEAFWNTYRMVKDYSGIDPIQEGEGFFSTPQYRAAFREAWTYTQDVIQNSHISRLFVQYRMNFEEKIQLSYDPESGASIPERDIIKTLGTPPWKTINDLFEKYGFKYRINNPQRATESYVVHFFHKDTPETKVAFAHLSSGEQMIVTLILWSFNEKFGELKKLLILDEPDAHLHPEMAKMFKEIISDILVKQYGIQVIMTTHSPTTLCWIEEESIFLMNPESGLHKATKQESLDKLTSGLLFVHQSFKIILVEDKDDQKFHQAIYDEAAYIGELPKEPRLTFKPVVTDGVNGGGKTVVINSCKQWEQFSSTTSLNDVLFGLVDKDKDDNSDLPPSVKHLSRYCFENYLADPLVIFALLVEEKTEDHRIKAIMEKHDYRKGELLKFKNNQLGDAQDIVDTIIQILVNASECPLSPKQANEKIQIDYLNGVKIDVPKVFFEESGKDVVLTYFKSTFSKDSGRMNVYKIQDILIASHLIPYDLLNVYKQYI